MFIARRYALRLLWAVCVLAAATAVPATSDRATSAPRTSTAAQAAPSDPLALRLPPEVRIRRLHLVRPDLIPYPIAYEVVC